MYTKFTYFSYLQNKYGVDTPTTMLKIEADMIGIKYPLVSGWRERHTVWLNRALTDPEMEFFLAGLIRKKRDTIQTLERSGKHPKKQYELEQRLASLQTGIDFILGRPFLPISRQDKKIIEEERQANTC
jgi:hypothetical protein